MRKQHRYIYR